jgi:hypothetical protein
VARELLLCVVGLGDFHYQNKDVVARARLNPTLIGRALQGARSAHFSDDVVALRAERDGPGDGQHAHWLWLQRLDMETVQVVHAHQRQR